MLLLFLVVVLLRVVSIPTRSKSVLWIVLQLLVVFVIVFRIAIGIAEYEALASRFVSGLEVWVLVVVVAVLVGVKSGCQLLLLNQLLLVLFLVFLLYTAEVLLFQVHIVLSLELNVLLFVYLLLLHLHLQILHQLGLLLCFLLHLERIFVLSKKLAPHILRLYFLQVLRVLGDHVVSHLDLRLRLSKVCLLLLWRLLLIQLLLVICNGRQLLVLLRVREGGWKERVQAGQMIAKFHLQQRSVA